MKNLYEYLRSKFTLDFWKMKILLGRYFYNEPHKYWDHRWKLNTKRDNENRDHNRSVARRRQEEIIKKVASIHNCNNILEVGCGRFSFHQLPNYIGLDFSKTILLKWKRPDTLNASASCLPFRDLNFDMLLSRTVLMHVKPADIERTVEEISRVVKKAVFLFPEPYRPGSQPKKKHIFYHDYPGLFGKRGFSFSSLTDMNDCHVLLRESSTPTFLP